MADGPSRVPKGVAGLTHWFLHHSATRPELAGESYLRKWAEAAKNVWARCSPKDTATAEDEEPGLRSALICDGLELSNLSRWFCEANLTSEFLRGGP